ncbi:MAG: N-acetyl-gamma-glutamyl-phosphate reductase [Rhodoluna sp.]|nr:N-acetyl-gamma-glutamyl-phosphate reductase [Rhodoluna sp.]
MKTVAIAGASGYVGGELLRLVAAHPQLKLVAATANSNAGATIGSLHPHLVELADVVLLETTPANLSGADIVFLALPHTTSAEVAGWLREDQIVLDCGADFRLESAEQWAKFYGTEHQGTWTYGMPELVLADGKKQRENLKGAKRIAVPGCNVTAITLALAPLANAGVIELDDIVSVLSVGTSGAGRTLKANLLASEVSGSANAYGVGGVHRHTPEIEQNLSKAAGADVKISFTPVLVPMSRGILAVNTATAKTAGAREALETAYANEPFVHVLADGEYPATSSTLGANTCLIGVTVDAHANRVVVVSAIDNLVKGTAGAAIQSLNLALGLPEDTGLTVNGVAP